MAACAEDIHSSLEDTATITSTLDATITSTLDERFLQCPIHLEQYVKPKMLPCLHSVCYDCLVNWVEEKNGILECPECRKEHPIPEEGITALPDNFHLNNLIEFLQQVGMKSSLAACEAKPPNVCGLCDKTEEVVKWCVDCVFHLCNSCVSIHDKMCSGKSTMTSEEFEKLSDADKIHLTPVFCNKHPKITVEFFCKTCQIPVCSKCTIVQHKAPEHKHEEIEDTYRKMSQSLRSHVDNACHKKDLANEGLESMQNIQELLFAERLQALEEARHHADFLKEMVDMHLTDMAMEIEQDYHRKENALEEWQKKITFFSKEVTDGVYFAENLLKFGNHVTVTTTSKQASVHLKSLIKQFIPTQASCDFKIEFIKNQSLVDEMKEISLGSIDRQDDLLDKLRNSKAGVEGKQGSEQSNVHEIVEKVDCDSKTELGEDNQRASIVEKIKKKKVPTATLR